MLSKKYFKIVVDIGMFLLFLLLMGAHLTSSTIHEWLGIGLFVCFILHNILNYKWYRALFKGKYTVLRWVQTGVNVLLLFAVLGCLFSSLVISGVVFRSIRFSGIELGRGLHMLCTAWGFVLMNVHLGLHIKLPKTTKILPIILYISAFIMAVYGIVVFAERKLWQELFLLAEYKWFDYDKTVRLYLLETFSISVGFATLTYMIKRFGLKIKERHSEKKP